MTNNKIRDRIRTLFYSPLDYENSINASKNRIIREHENKLKDSKIEFFNSPQTQKEWSNKEVKK